MRFDEAMKVQTMHEELTDEMARLRAENERLRAALYDIIELDHHNHGPETRATALARAAIVHEQKMPKGPAGDAGQVGWMGGEHDR